MKNSADGLKRQEKFFDKMIADFTNNQWSKIYYIYVENQDFLQLYSHNYYEKDDEDGTPLLTIPFWSEEYLPYAKIYKNMLSEEINQNLLFDEIYIDDFVFKLLPKLAKANRIIGLNWDRDGAGSEIRPAKLRYMLVELLPDLVPYQED